MQYPQLYLVHQNPDEPNLLSEVLPTGMHRISIGDAGQLSCSVNEHDGVILLSLRFELQTTRSFVICMPPPSVLAILSLKGASHISTANDLQSLIPQHCGQIIHSADGKINVPVGAGLSEMIQICFPARHIGHLQKQYLLLRDFLLSGREGRDASLFPFPRILPDKVLALAEAFSVKKLTAVLWTCLLEERGLSTTEYVALQENGASHYDDDKFYHAALLLLTSPDQRITTSQLARKVHLNEFRLKQGFKQKFGISMHAFQEKIRIEKAKAWVQENGKPLSRIANELGYSSLSHFSAVFKKRIGVRPGVYRRQLAGNTGEGRPG